MALSKRLRYEILRRDNFTCRYCGATAPDVKLTVDHVIPTALGGSDEPSNLVTACSGCNSGKTSSAPDQAIVDDVQEDALKWALAIQTAAQMRREEVADLEVKADDFLEWWDSWGYDAADGERVSVPRAPHADVSVFRFLELGLSGLQLKHNTKVAMAAPKVSLEGRWSYFCGVCWGEIKKFQETAQEQIESNASLPEPLYCDICEVGLLEATERHFMLCEDCLYDRLKLANRVEEVLGNRTDPLVEA